MTDISWVDYEIMVEYGVATAEEINLVLAINGATQEALMDILYARTGFRNLYDYIEEYDVYFYRFEGEE